MSRHPATNRKNHEMAHPTFLKIDAVLHMVKQRPGLTQKEMAVALGYSAVNEVVKHLKEIGLIDSKPGMVQSGTRVPDVWHATDQGLATKTWGPEYGTRHMIVKLPNR